MMFLICFVFIFVFLFVIVFVVFVVLLIKIVKIDKGNVLIDVKGMMFYIFDKDVDGKFVCNGFCVINWLVLKVEVSDVFGDGYIIIICDDGLKQWVYKGKLFYIFVKDQKFGDIIGDGFLNGVWYFVMF